MKNYKTNVKCKYCNSTFSSDIFDEENVCPACKEEIFEILEDCKTTN